jgi:peroxiredoxin Q/BCP
VKSKNAVVYGVNPGSAESHKKFIDKNRLELPLLVDEGQEVARLYSAHGLFVKGEVVKDIVTSAETLQELEAFFAV